MKHIYTAVATATGDGRNGRTESDDNLLAVDVRTPKEMGGSGGATNPEQLFAAGYAACFHSALRFVGKSASADLHDSTISARVTLGVLPTGAFALAVQLDIHIPKLDDIAAMDLAQKAHQACPYSTAIRGNVEVALTIV